MTTPLLEYLSTSPAKTALYGRELSKLLKSGSLVCFLGDLGSGKTTLIKGLISSLTNKEEIDITSPTFTYLNIYSGKIDIYHFDLYRIKDADQFLNMGFGEYFSKNGICLIEWSERITKIIPKDAIVIHITIKEENSRQIVALSL